jgi:DNA-binding transcriptional LysR family regulator
VTAFRALPKKHPLAGRSQISLRDLRKEPFLLRRGGHCFRENAVAACDRARVSLKVRSESGQFSSLLGLAGPGMGSRWFRRWPSRPFLRFVRIPESRARRAPSER